MLKVVTRLMMYAAMSMSSMASKPLCPSIMPNRRKSRIEMIFKEVGTKTPAKVPSLGVFPEDRDMILGLDQA